MLAQAVGKRQDSSSGRRSSAWSRPPLPSTRRCTRSSADVSDRAQCAWRATPRSYSSMESSSASPPDSRRRHHGLELRQGLVEGHRGDGRIGSRLRVAVGLVGHRRPSLARVRRARPARPVRGARRAGHPRSRTGRVPDDRARRVAHDGVAPVERRERARGRRAWQRCARGRCAPGPVDPGAIMGRRSSSRWSRPPSTSRRAVTARVARSSSSPTRSRSAAR